MDKRTNTAVWMEKHQRWQVKVQRDGQRRTFTSSTPGRAGQREANAKADAWIAGESISSSKRLRVADAFEIYKEHMADMEAAKSGKTRVPGSEIKPRELANSRPAISLLSTWMLPPLKNKWMDQLTDADIQKILDKAYAKGRSKKTIQGIRSAMFAFIKFFRRAKVTSYRPDEIDIPSNARTKSKRILQPEDLLTLFSCDTTILNGKRCPDSFIHAYRLQVLTGIRPGELIGLDKEKSLADLDSNILHILRSINVYGQVTRGKNEHSIRDIVLYPLAKYEVLAQLLQNKEDQNSLFPIFSEITYRNRFKRYCAVNGLPVITPYELRHTFISIAQKLPEGELKTIVGHSQSMDTFGVYGHTVKGYAQDTGDRLEAIFKEILVSEK